MKHLVIHILAATATVLCTAKAHADLGDQLVKLVASDGAMNDVFGYCVYISGSTAIVGAYWDDDNGGDSGSAYLFNSNTGQQINKLLPIDGSGNDQFGWSAAISGNTAIVGAYGNDDFGSNSGSAYLFSTTTGQQLFKLLANDGTGQDQFGISVAIDGTTAIVGAYLDDDNGSASGSAYLFNTITGQQIAKLLPNDGAAGDQFGRSVAISGTIAIVGAYQDDDNGSASGSAYLFNTITGQQITKLLPIDGEADEHFGFSVAISGDIAIVGARFDDDNGTWSGSAYLFDTTGQQLFKLLPTNGAAGDRFGNSVSISGSRAIVGAHLDDDNGVSSGSAFLFDNNTGQQITMLLPNDGVSGDAFAISVGISGDIAIVGAYWDDDACVSNPLCESGSAYIFDAAGTPGNCPWDLDNSGSVGTGDLLELFAQWGTAGTADFDGSGAVGTSDLLILFANWGPCP